MTSFFSYKYLCRPAYFFGLSLFFLACSLPALSETADTRIKICVLSFRARERTITRWKPTADYLNRVIPGYSFEIIPMHYVEVGRAVKNKSIDFILTNTSQYVRLEAYFGISRMVTLVRSLHGKNVSLFGGVIFTRADRDDINTLKDLKGKSFIAVNQGSLGGFIAAWEELVKNKIDPFLDFKSFNSNELTYDRVVSRVENGIVDAGTVRTGIIEHLAKEKKINIKDFKIIGEKQTKGFPFIHSTRLYPEWPFSKLKHTDEELAKKVTISLLNLTKEDTAAKRGNYAKWMIPLDYQPVHMLMKRLKLPPYVREPSFTIVDVLVRYRKIIFLVLLSVFSVLFFVMYLARLNKLLNHEINERKLAEKAIIQVNKTQKILNRLLNTSLESYSLEIMLSHSLDIITSAPWLSQKTSACIFLVEEDPNVLVLRAQRRLSPSLNKRCQRVPFGKCLCGKAAKNKKIIFERSDSNDHILYKGMHKHSHYCVPILSSNTVLGVLNLYLGEKHKKSNAELRFLESFSKVLAGMIKRTRTKDILKESEERYRAVFEQGATSIMLVEPETGKIIDFNSKTHETLGYTREEFKKLRLSDIEAQESPSEVEAHIKKILEQGSDTFESTHKTKYGGIKHMLLNVRSISISGKKYIISSNRDITERKQAEKKFLIENAKFSAMVECMEEGVVCANEHDIVVEVNKFFCNFLGLERSSIIGKKLGDFHSRDLNIKISGILKTFRELSTSSAYEKHQSIGNKEVIFRVQAIYNEKHYEGVLINMVDVSELVKARENMKRKEAQIAYNAGLFESASSYLHNIGNALVGMDGKLLNITKILHSTKEYKNAFRMIRESHNSALQNKGKDNTEELLNRFENILLNLALPQLDDNFNRLREIRDTMALSIKHQQDTFNATRKRKGKYIQEIDIMEIVDYIRETLGASIDKNHIQLTVDLEQNSKILNQKYQLVYGLTNIIKNAIESIELSKNSICGKIFIRLGRAEKNKKRAVITITDNGVGIHHSYINKIFTSGFTTKRNGHGLGLHSFANFLKENNGSIKVFSDGLEHGAKFIVEIGND